MRLKKVVLFFLLWLIHCASGSFAQSLDAFTPKSGHDSVLSAFEKDSISPAAIQRFLAPIQTGHQFKALGTSCTSNLDFETGNSTGWTTTGSATIVSAGLDTFGLYPVSAPGGTYSLRLGDWYPKYISYTPIWTYQRSTAQNTFTIPAADPVIKLQYAFDILNFGNHTKSQAAYVQVALLGPGGPTDTIACAKYKAWDDNYGTGTKGFSISSKMGYEGAQPGSGPFPKEPVKYLKWRTLNFDLSAYVGQAVTISVVNSWCILNVDWAYTYIDASCAPPNQITQSDTLCGNTPVKLYPPLGFSSYSWTGPVTSTADTLITSTPGTYTLTCDNGFGCPYTYTYTLKQANVNLVPAFSSPSVCTETMSFVNASTVSTGTISKSLWSFGDAATDTLTVAGAGSTSHTYSNSQAYNVTLTVTTNTGCSSSITKSITPSQPPQLTTTVSPATCGLVNGKASVTAANGLPAYTYTWSNANTTASLNNLSGGVYSVTVTDANSCTASSTVTVASTPAVVASVGLTTPILCSGAKTGVATATASNGTAPFTYSWSNGVSAITTSLSNANNGLGVNTYSLTVTDANGCAASSSVTLTSPVALGLSLTPTSSSCGKSNGSVVAVASGGVTNYSYAWSNATTNNTLPAVAAGTYSLTVTDANGCTISSSTIVTDLSTLKANILAYSNLKCNGDTNGSLTVRASGGTGTLTYSWSNAGIDSVINGLGAGAYAVTVTDASGCSLSTNASITQPTQLKLVSTAINTSCWGGKNGQAVIVPSGGAGNYSATWSTSETGFSISNLSAGTYSVTVSDGNNCQRDTFLTINQPTALSMSVSATTAFCGQPGGTATVTNITGGTPNGGVYSYLWSTGATLASISGLVPGTYTVTVTDNNNCKLKDSATVSNVSGVLATISNFQNLSCHGVCNGTITASPTGGNAPYQYSWSNGFAGASPTGLCANSYTVTITDANQCAATAVQTLTQPVVLSNTVSQPDTACIGQKVWLVAHPSGGTPTYQLTWNPGALVGDSVQVSALSTTTFSVSGSDANACGIPQQTIQLPLHGPLGLQLSGVPSVCGTGNTIQINAVASGGNKQYTYRWLTNPNQTTQNLIAQLNATTTFTLVVTDGCGTPADSAKKQVTLLPAPLVNFSASKDSGCPTLCVNFKDLSVINGTDSIQSWLWTLGLDSISKLQNPSLCYPTGKYTIGLKVTTKAGCTSFDSISNMINVFHVPTAAFAVNPQQASEVNPLFSFYEEYSPDVTSWIWNFEDNKVPSSTSVLPNPVFQYDSVGAYCPKLWVTNVHGCKDSVVHCINYVSDFSFYVPDAFTPNGDNVNDVFMGYGSGYQTNNFNFTVFDRWGQVMFTGQNPAQGWNGVVQGSAVNAPQDVYSYLIQIYDNSSQRHEFVGHVTLIR